MSRLKSTIYKTCKFFIDDKVPLIFNILVVIGTALLTYYVSPVLHNNFERQKLRSEYVLDNLKSINSHITQIYVDVGLIKYSIIHGLDEEKVHAKSALTEVDKINWKLIETASVLSEQDDKIKLERFQTSLIKVRHQLSTIDQTKNVDCLNDALVKMSQDGVLVIEAVSLRAALD